MSRRAIHLSGKSVTVHRRQNDRLYWCEKQPVDGRNPLLEVLCKLGCTWDNKGYRAVAGGDP